LTRAALKNLFEGLVDGWLNQLGAAYDHIIAVDRSTDDEIRWYVRMRGEDKDFTTVWLTLGQRTLKYETYVMGAPEENEVQLYESLLRRNDRLVGAHFSVGFEDAVYLRGETPVSHVSMEELDRILGTLGRALLPGVAAHRLCLPLLNGDPARNCCSAFPALAPTVRVPGRVRSGESVPLAPVRANYI